ncbi:polyisoprenyl-teichoic acid--peptidoglycan teichoic acid transferase TagU [Paenisporosarcina antarctica]|uniref:Polyisoprenyl-teichoic acid--peptidoglycan teichoic acid transferase TagU n=1 Tax=Paenisporosarcina antarctica TaxID=417367 RepID=A0A4P7A226_9BACL|nr:LytR family transcriptional regulator [Paenisporosarcina antarctica]QBP42469.1 LytR family transcriptional regulator [Paenisporosarcina antarctica]
MEGNSKQEKGKKSRKLTFNIIIGISLFLIIGVCVYGFSVYRSVANTLNSTHEPLNHEVSKNRDLKINFSEQDSISILLLGVDERESDRGRSDSLILLTVNPKDQSSKMVSIPRDTRTEIAGQGKEDKINHAYSFGGVETTIETVEDFLDVPIDFYIELNMESFKDIVNALGGVKVNNAHDFTYDGKRFPEGQLQINGTDALKYSRMRSEDPRGDLGRQDRQRLIIQAVINKGANIKSLANYNDFLDVIAENVRTNLTFNDMKDIQSNYKAARQNIQQVQINGEGTEINGVYYYVVSQSVRTELSSMLKQHLNVN